MWGDPDHAHGRVAVAEVARALAELGDGFHEGDRIYEVVAARHDRPLNPRSVAAVVGKLGCPRVMREGQRGRTIDLARLAERWPRLPWSA